MRHLSAVELAEWLTACAAAETTAQTASRPRPLLLDVREPWEHALCQLPGSRLLPMSAVPAALDQLDRQAETVIICHHGIRSLQVAYFLERQGFALTYNLSGGIDAWARDVDPLMHKY
ncbi:MAG TPA: rhodanese-like domain-containing protein [Accumulibacter sp.]|nr:rhodanese-like domain-containing protein [Accumulibacter sp.]HMW16643.1 rhodanese-like domain-containing protein [Accumulibacter sp.]HMX22993.1 rhodanese-like domain-containing protein [Accumulibacter sp.]HMY06782.1 rhodanese-like domain-containing protein [Accumulibacter sp.]HNC16712.1 rhodanese-like domain-containing protein [Accumulibacter sp.]